MLGTAKIIPGESHPARHELPDYTPADFKEITHGIADGLLMVGGLAACFGIVKAANATIPAKDLPTKSPHELQIAKDERIEGGLVILGGLTVMLTCGAVVRHTAQLPEAQFPEPSDETAGAPPDLIDA